MRHGATAVLFVHLRHVAHAAAAHCVHLFAELLCLQTLLLTQRMLLFRVYALALNSIALMRTQVAHTSAPGVRRVKVGSEIRVVCHPLRDIEQLGQCLSGPRTFPAPPRPTATGRPRSGKLSASVFRCSENRSRIVIPR